MSAKTDNDEKIEMDFKIDESLIKEFAYNKRAYICKTIKGFFFDSDENENGEYDDYEDEIEKVIEEGLIDVISKVEIYFNKLLYETILKERKESEQKIADIKDEYYNKIIEFNKFIMKDAFPTLLQKIPELKKGTYIKKVQ